MRIVDKIKDFILKFFGSKVSKRKQFIGNPNLFDENNINITSGNHKIINDTIMMNQKLIKYSKLKDEELYQELESSMYGLTTNAAEKKRIKFGLNEIEQADTVSWYHHLWLCYKNPFNLLLTGLDIFFVLTNDVRGTIVITLMVFISTLLRFVQERRSNIAAEKLKAIVSTTATILRSDHYHKESNKPFVANNVEIQIKNIVIGDVVVLSAGDLIPADVRILNAKDLFVSQSALTGEALPVEKFAHINDNANQILEMENIGFMGSNVISGSALAIVVATGKNTLFGSLANKLIKNDKQITNFQSGINKVSWLLIYFMFIMSPIVFVLNGVTKHDWMSAAMFALAIAVGLTPEMLPMIITSTLAKGAVIMSRRKVVVKNLDAIQNFGAMTILCADKTGTLTQDKICLERHTDIMGNDCDQVLEYAYLNSYYQTGLKNLLDVAVLERANFGDIPELIKCYKKVDEVPFDFKRRRMSVVVAKLTNQDNMSDKSDVIQNYEHTLICKGAVEELISCCNTVYYDNKVLPLTDALLAQLTDITASLNAEGLRVVAVAIKNFNHLNNNIKNSYHVVDENDMTLVGYIAFMDPPKETSKAAIAALNKHGVSVKILTGDNELVSKKVCREVGLQVEGVLLGAEIDLLSDDELSKIVEDTTLFAKLTPDHKERIVSLLKSQGHTVGFMGDGINDAAALRSADIGISVDSAVDIAKEAADIILLEKSLMVLEEGIEEGRKTFANMLKYIKITASSNFGNVFSMLVASAFLPFEPMLPMHLLVLNLLYDISQIAIPFDNVDKEFIAKPQSWNPQELKRFIIFFGPISSIFDITTFIILWYFYGANSVSHASFFQTGWFVESLCTQLLIVHMIRTRKIPFLQSCASMPMIIVMLIILILGLSLPLMPITAVYFKMQSLPISYFAWLSITVVSYLGLTQIMKNIYAKKYGWY